ncbi:MAG TPA: GGDEF domain-containing protein [Aquabacterium sp.]|uniref:GGDEF domain-containing protein n=1 Tax=Aquabacterium sp. TaxID=1872578 RepID=UPI002E3799A1|nr:GGDEF domain-containing protein [Aquabacterium sp.]HEX5356430.1 GGDEF domain-containing protein [Aquabacterium sp.]
MAISSPSASDSASVLPQPATPVSNEADQQAWHVGTEATQPEAFRALLQGIGVIAGLTHVAFCALFFWAHVTSLAYVNIGSILSYVWVFALARRGQVEQAWAVTVLEVLGHAILAVSVIGWDTGFHYYILLVIPVAVISSIRPVALKAATVLGVMMTYLVLDIVLRHRTPPNELPMVVIDGLHYFNVVGVMIILIFLAGYYYYLIDKAAATLREMASTDPLTQLRNRRAITEVIRREESRVRRGQPYLSFILCDLDHFKSINDSKGHDAGDAVLRSVSKTLQSCMRDVDFVARWGGEEFLAVLPDTDEEGAKLVAERIRGKIEGALIEAPGHEPFKVTMTLGVAVIQKGENAEQTIARADTALYEGKRNGRNRVVVAAAS